ncbi:MAG: glycogen/starch synthase [Proteobacteria bacterium]|nr:glycogen/starch synthase [Pseudomonadota bacterium]
MSDRSKNPRILIVTPEVTYLPEGMGNLANNLYAKAGGLADVSAALISALFENGADVHVAIPDYRSIYDGKLPPLLRQQRSIIRKKMPEDRIHLAEDRAFFYLHNVYSSYEWENSKISLAFQREVINNIVPRVQPDLIHCNDWMTGLVPAMSRAMGIPCLFTIHNIFSVKKNLAEIEDRGIDAATFWNFLFYERMPHNYEETRDNNKVDFLSSGVFASHFVNTVSPTFLLEVVDGHHRFVADNLKNEFANKCQAGCATGILNAPDPSYRPETDDALFCQYDSKTQYKGKKANKKHLQMMLGLTEDENAPLFFWPSRLDTVQKGAQLLADILYSTVSKYWKDNLQIVFVANGEFENHFKQIVWQFNLHNHVSVCGFDEKLSRLAYGASDYILMPSAFEPCGLPQMIGAIYGSIPVVHDVGGLHDTVEHLNVKKHTGNGFAFKTYDANGLSWAIDQVMEFHKLSESQKNMEISRIMAESQKRFNHSVTAREYIKLYEKMLERPFVS